MTMTTQAGMLLRIADHVAARGDVDGVIDRLSAMLATSPSPATPSPVARRLRATAYADIALARDTLAVAPDAAPDAVALLLRRAAARLLRTARQQ
jgi:hypothetical protein